MKRYKAIFKTNGLKQYSAFIKVDNKTLHISFFSFDPRVKVGGYATDDPKISKALQELPAFGKMFRLISETTTPIDKGEKQVPINKLIGHEQDISDTEKEVPGSEEEPKDPEGDKPNGKSDDSEPVSKQVDPVDNSGDKIIINKEVKTLAEARLFVNKTTGIAQSKLRNFKIVLEECRKNNISLPVIEAKVASVKNK